MYKQLGEKKNYHMKPPFGLACQSLQILKWRKIAMEPFNWYLLGYLIDDPILQDPSGEYRNCIDIKIYSDVLIF